MSKSDGILKMMSDCGVKIVRFIYVGTDAVIRAKSAHIDHLKDMLENGIGLTKAMQSFSTLDHLVPEPAFGPQADDVFLIPDIETLVPLPYAPGSARAYCDLVRRDGKPWELCTRSILKRVVGKIRDELGLVPQIACESEFYILKSVEGRYEPFDSSRCFSTQGYDAGNELIQEWVKVLKAMGVDVVRVIKEYGPGQYEVNLRHAEPLKAAENFLTLKDVVKGTALLRGLQATFMAKPFSELAGSGLHLHMSMIDSSGANVFYDMNDPHGLSEIGYLFAGGIKQHIKALTAIGCPTVNSYKRFRLGSWAPTHATFGYNNRSCALRVPTIRSGMESRGMRVEFRVPDAACNPYLMIAATLLAGLDGIKKGIDPGEPVEVDAYTLKEAEPLPNNLKEALDALTKDRVIVEGLGATLIGEFVKMKMAEWDEYHSIVTDWERRIYIPIF
ncbi:MAG: glutamine synthetase family protein [Candidatus Methanomethyliaceae archaeon]|nr:glutamine synthetase family protein [Candidatus Methanomethyliaceae archaeon]